MLIKYNNDVTHSIKIGIQNYKYVVNVVITVINNLNVT